MPAPLDLSPRRREILDGAVAVLAALGWRGLTHRAIDRESGLPQGSSSAYYRSRSALTSAMAQYVAWQLSVDVEALAAVLAQRPGDHDHAVAATASTFQRWLAEPHLLTARLELTLAAARDPELAAALSESRAALVTIVDNILDLDGRTHATGVGTTILAAVDGVLIAALLRPEHERADFVSGSLDLLFGSLVEARPPS